MLLNKTLLLSTTQLIDMHWQKVINEVKTSHYHTLLCIRLDLHAHELQPERLQATPHRAVHTEAYKK